MLDLFGRNDRYYDEARSIYEDFISYAKNRRLIWGIKYQKDLYKQLRALSHIAEDGQLSEAAAKDPILAAEVKKFAFLKKGLPVNQFLANYGRVLYIENVEKQMTNPKTSKKFNLRRLMDSYFTLYKDDQIKLTLKLHKKVFFEGEGLMSEIFVPLEKMQNLPMNMGKEELLTVEIVLLNEGSERRLHEDLSNIYETDREIDSYLNLEYQIGVLKSLPDDLREERLKLFGISSPDELLEPKDFGFKNLSAFMNFFDRIGESKFNNQLLLESDDGMMDVEFDKMRQWLTRANPDGHNGYA